MNLNDLAKEAYLTASNSGFHRTDELIKQISYTSLRIKWLGLIASEIGEAIEACRNNDDPGLAVELADIIIRVLDMSHEGGIDIHNAVLDKMAANKDRPYLHGGKLA